MVGNSKVQSRLLLFFVLQLALISLVTITGVLAASIVAERVLVNKALSGEAEYFWKHRLQFPEFALPNTLNLQSYISSDESIEMPASLADLELGQQRVDILGDDRIVHVSERNGERLYLLFQDETVTALSFWFGVLPLTFVLLIMYSLAWLTYYLSKRAVSPMTRLAAVIERFDFENRDASELDLSGLENTRDTESLVLMDALQQFTKRSKASIERERTFTRYASHELRTPLAVIQGSLSSLELMPLEGAPARAIARMKRTVRHMTSMLEALLMLAREGRAAEQATPIDVNSLLDRELAELKEIEEEKPIKLSISHEKALSVMTDDSSLSILFGNLLRNAWRYTSEGSIDVRVNAHSVSIRDTGRGMSESVAERVFEPFYRAEREGTVEPGQGLGLAIAGKICENHGWDISVQSARGQGSEFLVKFNP